MEIENKLSWWERVHYRWVELKRPSFVILRALVILRTIAHYDLARRPLPWIIILFLKLVKIFTCWGWWNLPDDYGARLRLAFEDLGPIFVKLGQMLATRGDILTPTVADQLAELCDKVKPVPVKIAHYHLQHIYKNKLAGIFQSIEDKPLGSASIAQVYGATLLTGEEVVIKILRPGIRQRVRRELALMSWCACGLSIMPRLRKRLRPRAIVAEFANILTAELDLAREGGNMALIAHNFAGHSVMRVPKVYWEHTHSSSLVSERIYAVNINDLADVGGYDLNYKLLAENGVKIFLDQVFRDGFFHADMHHGNVFVDITNPDNPCYIAVDFGIVGSLSEQVRLNFALIMTAFFARDYDKVAKLHQEFGWIPANANVAEFAAEIRTVSEPIFAKNIGEISFGPLVLKLLAVARKFELRAQPELLLLQKTLMNVESLGRKLYPELNLWETVYPYLRQWVKQQIGVQGTLKRSLEMLPEFIQVLPNVLTALQGMPATVAHDGRRSTSSGVTWIMWFLVGVVILIGSGYWVYINIIIDRWGAERLGLWVVEMGLLLPYLFGVSVAMLGRHKSN